MHASTSLGKAASFASQAFMSEKGPFMSLSDSQTSEMRVFVDVNDAQTGKMNGIISEMAALFS